MLFKDEAIVIKFGGSMSTYEQGANSEYFNNFFQELEKDILSIFSRAAFVIGGGQRVRTLQSLVETNREKDTVGIAVLREHASQMREIIRDREIRVNSNIPTDEVDAQKIFKNNHEFSIALGGLKIGQSTDTVAVTAAELFEDMGYDPIIIFLSNIANIYTGDPRVNPEASPITQSSIRELIREGVLVDDPKEFRPGMHVTIDPVAVSKLRERPYPILFTHGMMFESVRNFLLGKRVDNGTILDANISSTKYFKK